MGNNGSSEAKEARADIVRLLMRDDMRQVRDLLVSGDGDAGANIFSRSSLQPLYSAIKDKNLTSLKRLLQNPNTDVNAKVADLTPLHFAVTCGNFAVVKELLCHKDLDLNPVMGKDQKTPLMLAVYCGEHTNDERAKIVRALCEDSRCDFTQHDTDKYTALTYACHTGNEDAVKILVQSGRAAKYEWKDLIGDCRVAMKRDHEPCADIIIENLTLAQQRQILELRQGSRTEDRRREGESLEEQLERLIRSLRTRDSTTSSTDANGIKVEKGDYVQLLPSLEKVKELQKGHGGWINPMSTVLGKVAGVADVDKDGDLELDFDAVNVGQLEKIIVNPKAVIRLSKDGAEASDCESNHTMKRGDLVKLTVTDDELQKLQPGHGSYNSLMKEYIQKMGKILFVMEDGDIFVQINGRSFCYNSKAFRKVDYVVGADGRKIELGETVRITVANVELFEALQTKEYGGWNPRMANIMGKICMVKKITCNSRSSNSDGAGIIIQYGENSYQVNPAAASSNTTIEPAGQTNSSSNPGKSESAKTENFTSGVDLKVIPKKDLKLEKKLGNGSFGIVFQAKWIAANCAAKVISSRDIVAGEEKERILQEAMIHSRLIHPNIVQFFGIVLEETQIHMVMRMVDGHNLEEIITNNVVQLSAAEKHHIGLQVCGAIQYLHEVDVLHQDIKPSNVMVEESTKNALITDFGISRLCGMTTKQLVSDATRKYTSTMKGTFYYIAPELLNPTNEGTYRQPTKKSDVFSLGATLTELYAGMRLYGNAANEMDFFSVSTKRQSGETPAAIHKLPANYKPIMSNSLNVDPAKRPTARGLQENLLKLSS